MTDYYNNLMTFVTSLDPTVLIAAACVVAIVLVLHLKSARDSRRFAMDLTSASGAILTENDEALQDLLHWTWDILVEEGIMVKEVTKDDGEETVTAYTGRKRAAAAAKKKAAKPAKAAA